MTRRELLALIGSAPLLKAAPEAPTAPVSIAKCASYNDDVTATLATMFDQLGGLERIVKNKTVTIKLNLTGSPCLRLQGRPLGVTHYTIPSWLAPLLTSWVVPALGASALLKAVGP